MRFFEIAIAVCLLSFFAGIYIHSNPTPSVYVDYTQRRPENVTQGSFTKPTKPHPSRPKPGTIAETDLKPCSQVNTMPCTESPTNPLREALDAKDEATGIFKKGQMVTCIYPGVFYHEACSKDQCDIDDSEFIKNVAVECRVTQASEVYNGDTQQIKVNCTKDLSTKWSAKPGPTMVKDHKLNKAERWFFSEDCYHFTKSGV